MFAFVEVKLCTENRLHTRTSSNANQDLPIRQRHASVTNPCNCPRPLRPLGSHLPRPSLNGVWMNKKQNISDLLNLNYGCNALTGAPENSRLRFQHGTRMCQLEASAALGFRPNISWTDPSLKRWSYSLKSGKSDDVPSSVLESLQSLHKHIAMLEVVRQRPVASSVRINKKWRNGGQWRGRSYIPTRPSSNHLVMWPNVARCSCGEPP